MTLPTRMTNLLHLHKSNIKSLTFLNSEGTLAASGSSDCTVKIFSTVDGSVRHTLRGHTSRVWDLDANATGMLASASGDGSVRLWSTEGESRGVLEGDGGDVYGVRWRTGHEVSFLTRSYRWVIADVPGSTGDCQLRSDPPSLFHLHWPAHPDFLWPLAFLSCRSNRFHGQSDRLRLKRSACQTMGCGRWSMRGDSSGLFGGSDECRI